MFGPLKKKALLFTFSLRITDEPLPCSHRVLSCIVKAVVRSSSKPYYMFMEHQESPKWFANPGNYPQMTKYHRWQRACVNCASGANGWKSFNNSNNINNINNNNNNNLRLLLLRFLKRPPSKTKCHKDTNTQAPSYWVWYWPGRYILIRWAGTRTT